jgi:DNA-binding transcriptional LysR family regulator
MDLNLLRVFVTVYETRSLTTSASRLFVTQPAVSQALGRLRRDFDDPLFRRVGRVMEPTPLAESMFPELRDALSRIQRTLDAVHGFDAAASDKRFRVAMSELGEIGYFAAMCRAVRSVAPHVRLETVALDVDELPDQLARGTVDLAISSSPVGGAFPHVVLKSQGYAALMSAQHPLATGALSFEDYLAAPHVAVAGDSGRLNLQAALRRRGTWIDPDVTLNRFASVPPLLATSHDLIATVPDTIGEGWATAWPLVVRPLPFEMERVDVSLYRRSSTQQTAALDWLYDTAAQALRGTHGEFAAIRAGEGAA